MSEHNNFSVHSKSYHNFSLSMMDSIVEVAIVANKLAYPLPKLEPLPMETKEETKLIREPEPHSQERQSCSPCYVYINVVQFLFWCGIIGVCSWMVNDARIVVEHCKSLNFYYQNGCFNNHNADVVKYAVGIPIIIMCLFMLIRQIGEICRVVTRTNWPRTSKQELCAKWMAWILFGVLIGSLVCVIYFSTRDLVCKGHNSDYQEKRDAYIACMNWKSNIESHGHLLGLIFGIIGAIVSFLALWFTLGVGGYLS